MSDAAKPSFKDNMMKWIGKFSGSRFVRAIMSAGYAIISFSIIGSIFLILTVITQVITVKGFVDFYNSTLGRFSDVYQAIYNATMGIIALIFGGTFAYSYADIYKKEENLNLDPLNAVFLAFMGLFITVAQFSFKGGVAHFLVDTKNGVIGGYATSTSGITRIGATGIFTAIIVSWVAVQIYRFCIKHNWRIAMPASVPAGVSNSFSSLIPGFLIALVIALADGILIAMGTDIFQVLYIPFSFISNIVGTWWGVLIVFFLIGLLWWFGIHGATIISSFYQAITLSNLAANATSGAHHVFAGEFTNAFVFLGGSGATLGMALWMAFAAKSAQLKSLGKLEAIPALFNINEPILFGLPIVYNVYLFIPFLLAPMASSMIAYFAIDLNIVPKIIVQQPWPTPIGLGGMVATASWQGAVLSVVTAIVAFLIWYPFIKAYDRKLLKQEKEDAAKNAAANN